MRIKMDHPLYQHACQLIDNSSLKQVNEQLKRYLKPGIRMESSSPLVHSLPPGESKLGGLPDLPPTLLWPQWKNVPMVFLAQIALQDVTSYDREQVLPSSGFLYFFCQSQNLFQGVDIKVWDYIDPQESESWKVLFFDGNKANLRRTPAPEGLPPHALLPDSPLHFWPVLLLPPLESILIASLNLHREERKEYLTLLNTFENAFSKENAFSHHRLLGYPIQMQDDMQLLCYLCSNQITYEQWVHFDEEAKILATTGTLEWLHLLQIDTDERAQITWGEGGSLSYWINQADLKLRNFAKCWAIEDSL